MNFAGLPCFCQIRGDAFDRGDLDAFGILRNADQ